MLARFLTLPLLNSSFSDLPLLEANMQFLSSNLTCWIFSWTQVSKPGSVEVEKLMNIERYSHVMHISSTVCSYCNFTNKQTFNSKVLVPQWISCITCVFTLVIL